MSLFSTFVCFLHLLLFLPMLFRLCTHSAPALNYFTHYYYCRPLSNIEWRRRRPRKKIRNFSSCDCDCKHFTLLFFRRRGRIASMAICSQFAVLSILPSHSCHYFMWLQKSRISFTRQFVCLFSSEKKEPKNINYCYGPLRWSQYITAGTLRWPQTHTHKLCLDASNKYYISKLNEKKRKKERNMWKKKQWKEENMKNTQFNAILRPIRCEIIAYARATANCPRAIQTKFPERKVKDARQTLGGYVRCAYGKCGNNLSSGPNI